MNKNDKSHQDLPENEICEEQLENVSGGAGVYEPTKTCPMCGGIMQALLDKNFNLFSYNCEACSYKERK